MLCGGCQRWGPLSVVVGLYPVAASVPAKGCRPATITASWVLFSHNSLPCQPETWLANCRAWGLRGQEREHVPHKCHPVLLSKRPSPCPGSVLSVRPGTRVLCRLVSSWRAGHLKGSLCVCAHVRVCGCVPMCTCGGGGGPDPLAFPFAFSLLALNASFHALGLVHILFFPYYQHKHISLLAN